MRRLVAFAICGLATAAALPAAASAYEIGGSPWPDERIRWYSAAPRYTGAVARAARVWNKAGVGVRFVRSSRSRADVIMRYGGPRCGGAAPVGYGRRWRDRAYVALGAGCRRDLIMLTAVHELGHILGLDHETGRCARMNPGFDATGTPGSCRRRSLSAWVEAPLLADDVDDAKAIYLEGEREDRDFRDGERPWWW